MIKGGKGGHLTQTGLRFEERIRQEEVFLSVRQFFS